MTGLSVEAMEAQEYLMKQPDRIRKLAAFGKKKAAKKGPMTESFSRISDREVQIN